MTTIPPDDPRRTTPADAGRYRPLRDAQPGWWIRLEPHPPGHPHHDPAAYGAWLQIAMIADTTVIATGEHRRHIVFSGGVDGENHTSAGRDEQVRMMTGRQGRAAGLRDPEN